MNSEGSHPIENQGVPTESGVDTKNNNVDLATNNSEKEKKGKEECTNNKSPHSLSEKEYESEPASLKSLDKRKKKRIYSKSGKTLHPKVTAISREVRKLVKKHFDLEKNLKIDGIPEQQQKIRKRRMSFAASGGRDRESPYKRKRLNSSESRPKKDHMPKWEKLGGDATDPLNLNGLATSEEGRLLNLKTPESSPMPIPEFRKVVYVKVPPNIEDPLNLEGRHDQKVIDMLLNTTIKKRHRSKKNKNTSNQVKSEDTNIENPKSCIPEKINEECPNPSEDAERKKILTRSVSNSPERKVKRQINMTKGVRQALIEPKKFPDNPKFTLGNYNRYYGYRNQDCLPDPRLKYFNPEWFHNKDVLDIGCNVGHLTLAVAEQFSPHKILGIDIDGKLIGAARQNIRQILSQSKKRPSKYPTAFGITRGSLEAHPLTGSTNIFPNNVLFLQGNYIPGSIEILNLQKEEHDTILALSITKWIHLNNGDHGLKLFFQKIFRQLRPGGRFILEPQPWSTYRKRAKLSPELFKNYSSIKLKPEGFKRYLLSIGFVKCEVIGVPVTKAKGFRRPLILFTKSDTPSGNLTTQDQAGCSNDFRACTECPTGDQTMCDHIHSTGMRQGAYADRLYDHISYRPVTTEPIRNFSFPSPLNFKPSDSNSGRKDSPFMPEASSYFASSPLRSFYPNSLHSNSSKNSTGSSSSPLPRSSKSLSQSLSESESSWTSSTSASASPSSLSSSSYSESSTDSTNDLNNGLVNGERGDYSNLNGNNGAGHGIQWVDNENANMEFDDVIVDVEGIEDPEPLHGGLMNGDISSDD